MMILNDLNSLPGYINNFLQRQHTSSNHHAYEVCEVKSAQQKIWIVKFTQQFQSDWFDEIKAGGNQVVVRQWKGSARWWNLNINQSSHESIARAEVAAYRIAYKALPTLWIPKVLHFDSYSDQDSSIYPWAIFSYVGKNAAHFHSGKVYTEEWIHGMITVRHEFGFDEPHPRWGRVPVERAIEYASQILYTVIIPLHQYLSKQTDLHWDDLCSDGKGYTYEHIINVYLKAYTKFREMSTISDVDEYQMQFSHVIDTLGRYISKAFVDSSNINPLPMVLVHMDCQPQNMIFCRSMDVTYITSVLDWEEAAYADPRFELLLLCRKVCANRMQADVIWNMYETEYQLLGDITPWLRLEAIHSLTTLILQFRNLQQGGRSPWESSKDLCMKIDRELYRLNELTFDANA
jgi:Phosphotransferase enzyme family